MAAICASQAARASSPAARSYGSHGDFVYGERELALGVGGRRDAHQEGDGSGSGLDGGLWRREFGCNLAGCEEEDDDASLDVEVHGPIPWARRRRRGPRTRWTRRRGRGSSVAARARGGVHGGLGCAAGEEREGQGTKWGRPSVRVPVGVALITAGNRRMGATAPWRGVAAWMASTPWLNRGRRREGGSGPGPRGGGDGPGLVGLGWRGRFPFYFIFLFYNSSLFIFCSANNSFYKNVPLVLIFMLHYKVMPQKVWARNKFICIIVIFKMH